MQDKFDLHEWNKKRYLGELDIDQNINKDDVKTIHDHFKEIRGRAKLHRMDIRQQDYVVGVMYGTAGDISAHYKKLRDEYDYTLYVILYSLSKFHIC